MEPEFPTQCLALTPELHHSLLDSVSKQRLQAMQASQPHSCLEPVSLMDGKQG